MESLLSLPLDEVAKKIDGKSGATTKNTSSPVASMNVEEMLDMTLENYATLKKKMPKQKPRGKPAALANKTLQEHIDAAKKVTKRLHDLPNVMPIPLQQGQRRPVFPQAQLVRANMPVMKNFLKQRAPAQRLRLCNMVQPPMMQMMQSAPPMPPAMQPMLQSQTPQIREAEPLQNSFGRFPQQPQTPQAQARQPSTMRYTQQPMHFTQQDLQQQFEQQMDRYNHSRTAHSRQVVNAPCEAEPRLVNTRPTYRQVVNAPCEEPRLTRPTYRQEVDSRPTTYVQERPMDTRPTPYIQERPIDSFAYERPAESRPIPYMHERPLGSPSTYLQEREPRPTTYIQNRPLENRPTTYIRDRPMDVRAMYVQEPIIESRPAPYLPDARPYVQERPIAYTPEQRAISNNVAKKTSAYPTVKVTNIPQEYTRLDILGAFKDHFDVHDVIMKTRGCAFVLFKTVNDARLAKEQFDGGEMNEAKIKVSWTESLVV